MRSESWTLIRSDKGKKKGQTQSHSKAGVWRGVRPLMGSGGVCALCCGLVACAPSDAVAPPTATVWNLSIVIACSTGQEGAVYSP